MDLSTNKKPSKCARKNSFSKKALFLVTSGFTFSNRENNTLPNSKILLNKIFESNN
jgi:hypothetical protein